MVEPCIGVIGASKIDAATAELARAVGASIAKAGAVLVCGGLAGVMEAAAGGAAQEGGMTLGILPGRSRLEANPHISIPVVTGIGEARNAVVVMTSQAVIAIGGAYGTLSEIAFCLKLGIPVVGLRTWRLSHDSLALEDPIHRVQEPEQAVARALVLAGGVS